MDNLKVLSLFTGKEIDSVATPKQLDYAQYASLTRPELQLFDKQISLVDAKEIQYLIKDFAVLTFMFITCEA